MKSQKIVSTGAVLAMLLFATSSTYAATMAFDGFEAPNRSGFPTYFASNGTTYTDSEGRFYSGYTGLGTTHFGGAPKSGSQFLFIESYQGFNASVSQTYALDPGYYTLSYFEGGRGEAGGIYGSLTYDLVVDGNILGSFTTGNTGGSPSVLRTIPPFTVGLSGMTTVTFQGTGPNNADNMGFFDDLSITAAPVPEPGTFALLALGLTFLWRRRRSR